MNPNLTQTPLSFRQQNLARFFQHVRSGESFYLIGAPSVGKTRLMDFLMGDDHELLRADIEPERDQVKKHYLGQDLSDHTWLVRVDLNRLGIEYEWSFRFYELLLSALLFEASRPPQIGDKNEIKIQLAGLDSEVMQSKDPLRAHRFFEMAVNMLCQSYRIKLCFLFDEFDDTYQNMPREVFAQLRAIRDANKYRLCYGLFIRNLPEKLRAEIDNESFYELISRNLIGLTPYQRDDSLYIINQWESRHAFQLSDEKRDWLYINGGGHPGLMQALFLILKENQIAEAMMSNLNWYASQETVQEEFRKIWGGLLDEEQSGLLEFARGIFVNVPASTKKLLKTKGLLKTQDATDHYFSPLFGAYIDQQLLVNDVG
jgi:hypothetical protein